MESVLLIEQPFFLSFLHVFRWGLRFHVSYRLLDCLRLTSPRCLCRRRLPCRSPPCNEYGAHSLRSSTTLVVFPLSDLLLTSFLLLVVNRLPLVLRGSGRTIMSGWRGVGPRQPSIECLEPCPKWFVCWAAEKLLHVLF